MSAADGAVLVRASQARFGFFNQPRLLLYCALTAMLAAVFSIEGYGRTPKVLLGLAVALFVLAAVAGMHAVRLMGRGYGHGQEREIEVGAEGVAVREPGLNVAYAWSRFDRVVDLPDHLALFAGPGIVLLPKRAFAPDAFARVRELVAANVRAQAPH